MNISMNGSLMSFTELSLAVEASLFAGEGKQTAGGRLPGFSSVSIDSRTVTPGALFVALRGKARDGHSFVEAAFKAGASGAIVDALAMRDVKLDLSGLAEKWNRVLVCADDTLKAFQNAAKAYLARFTNLLKIGITGSAGKTTTKEIAAAIIGQEKSVVMNRGNLNSETGLPLSVFEVRPHHEVCIFEAAMNHRGEMSDLAGILNPDIALVTNIGRAHIGILGSQNAIAEEKKKIFSFFSGNQIALIPEDSPYRDFLAEGLRGKVCFYGEKTFPELGGTRSLGLEGSEFFWDGQRIRFALPGRHNFSNAVAAIAISREVPVGSGAVKKGLESVKPLFGRSEILQGRTTVVRDCINANPDSLAKALELCESLDWPGRRIYVIGEMLELGNESRQAHEKIGFLLVNSGADMVYLYGKETMAAAKVFDSARGDKTKSAPGYFHTCDMGELSRSLDSYVRGGDLVLLKGSKGCELWKLSGILTGNSEDELVSRLPYEGVS